MIKEEYLTFMEHKAYGSTCQEKTIDFPTSSSKNLEKQLELISYK